MEGFDFIPKKLELCLTPPTPTPPPPPYRTSSSSTRCWWQLKPSGWPQFSGHPSAVRTLPNPTLGTPKPRPDPFPHFSRGAFQHRGDVPPLCREGLLARLLCCHLRRLHVSAPGRVQQRARQGKAGRAGCTPSFPLPSPCGIFGVLTPKPAPSFLSPLPETIAAVFKSDLKIDFPFDLLETFFFLILGYGGSAFGVLSVLGLCPACTLPALSSQDHLWDRGLCLSLLPALDDGGRQEEPADGQALGHRVRTWRLSICLSACTLCVRVSMLCGLCVSLCPSHTPWVSVYLS